MSIPKKDSGSKDAKGQSTKAAEPDILIELLEGREEATLNRPFLPDENKIEVILSRNGRKKTYPLSEVCCILQKDDPNHRSTLHKDHDLMEIETLNGSQHLVRIAKDQSFAEGFYGSFLDLDNPYIWTVHFLFARQT